MDAHMGLRLFTFYHHYLMAGSVKLTKRAVKQALNKDSNKCE